MTHLFISYSRHDKRKVQNLAARLRQSGFEVWLDDGGIQGGEQWRSQITRALEGAEAFLLMISRRSVTSDEVRREVDIAVDSKTRLIPVLLEPATIPDSLQYQLAGLQRIELASDKTAFDKLVTALGGPRAVPKQRRNWVRGALFGSLVGIAAAFGIGIASHDQALSWSRELMSPLHMLWDGDYPGIRLLSFAAVGTFLAAVSRLRWRTHTGAALGLLLGVLWVAAVHQGFGPFKDLENKLFSEPTAIEEAHAKARESAPIEKVRAAWMEIRGDLLQESPALVGAKPSANLSEKVEILSQLLEPADFEHVKKDREAGFDQQEITKVIVATTVSGAVMGLTAGWLIAALLQILGRLASWSAVCLRWVTGE